MTEKEFNLSDNECNILINHIDMDKNYDITLCPICKKQVSSILHNTTCKKCSTEKNIISFITIKMHGKENLEYEKGFFTTDVREFIRQEKELLLKVRDGKISWFRFFEKRDKFAGEELT